MRLRAVFAILTVTAAATSSCSSSPPEAPGHAAGTVCDAARHIQTLSESSPINVSKVLDENSNMLSALPRLNAATATSAEQAIGTDALTLSKDINDVTTGGGSPDQLVFQLTKVTAECQGAGF